MGSKISKNKFWVKKKRLLFIVAFVTLTVSAFGQEILKIDWPDEYNWKIGSTQEDGKVHMIELIPGNETVDKWTIIGTMMSVKGVKNIPMDNAVKMMFDQAKQNAPKATVTLIEKNESGQNHWVIFKIETPRSNNDKNPESQLYYIIQGEASLYINFVAIKEKTLSKEFVDKWTTIFKNAELVYQ